MDHEILKNLGHYKLFEGLSKEELSLFETLLKIKEVEEGHLIIREKEEGTFIFLLLEGEVEITQALTLAMEKDGSTEHDTREKAFTRISHEVFPFIGEMSLFDKSQKRSATVKALSNCKIATIDNIDLLKLCDTNSLIGYKVMRNIAGKLNADLRQANQNILKLTTALNFILE